MRVGRRWRSIRVVMSIIGKHSSCCDMRTSLAESRGRGTEIHLRVEIEVDAPLLTVCHCSVTSKYMWPFNEDLTRFDFEIDGGQDMVDPLASLLSIGKGCVSRSDSPESATPDSSSC